MPRPTRYVRALLSPGSPVSPPPMEGLVVMKSRKVLRLLVAATMVLAILPTATMPAEARQMAETAEANASAAAGSTEASASGDVFSALGFDATDAPEGYEADSTDNPYGKDLMTANEVFEAFVVDDSSYWLAGHKSRIDDASEIAGSGPLSATVPGLQYRSIAAGDFDGDGLSGEMACVTYATTPSTATSRVLRLYLVDSSAHFAGPVPLSVSAEVTITLSGARACSEEWQNYLQIACGDFDGDTVSEIALYIGEPGNARVDVYKYARTAATPTPDDAWKVPDNWTRVWSRPLSTDPIAPNMVSLCAGDFNRDAIDDLAISYGSLEYKTIVNASLVAALSTERIVPSKAVALFGSRTAMLQGSQSIPLGAEPLARAAFAYGDIDGDNVRDLVLGAEPVSDVVQNKQRTVGMYLYDGQTLVLNSSTVDVVDGQSVDNKWVSNNGFDSAYCSIPVMLSNVSVVTPQTGGSTYVYLDSLLCTYSSSGFSIKAELDERNIYGDNTGEPAVVSWWLIADDIVSPQPDNHAYWEYGAVSGDITGAGAQALMCNFVTNGEAYSGPPPIVRDLKVLYYGWVDPGWPARQYQALKSTSIYRQGGYPSHAACFPNTDGDDTALMRYTGSHYLRYTDPRVLAVMASPPYFQDVAVAPDNSHYLDGLETSFGTSEGHGGGTLDTWSVEAGLWGEFELPLKIFVRPRTGVTYEHEQRTLRTTERSITFTTPGGEDSVAFYSVPIEFWVYEVLLPDPSGSYTTQYVTLTQPHTAAVQVLRLAQYESIRKDYEELPRISGPVLSHTLGDPDSYPASLGRYDVIAKDEVEKRDWAGTSFGSGSVMQELRTSEETSTSQVHVWSANVELGIAWGGEAAEKKAGFYVGGSKSWGGKSELDITGTSFSGRVKNMPLSQERYGYYFAWKLFVARGRIGDYSFPVVNYLVRDVVAPPKLPDNFAQNQALTTDSKVALTWDYDGAASYFHIYRYFDFPEGGGSYRVASVPASQYAARYDAEGLHKSYRFIDDGLSPYAQYKYQIQVERPKVPTLSAVSPAVTARTKTSAGYPDLSVLPSSLTIYPDRDGVLRAQVHNLTDYLQDTAYYKWQKLIDGRWTDVADANAANLVFSASSTTDAGSYRCRINVTTDPGNVAISSYSDPVTVRYSKRSVVFSAISAADTANGVHLSVNVKNAHADSGSTPAGKVTFLLTTNGAGSGFPYTAPIDSNGNAEVDVMAVPVGLYDVRAYYSGSRLFKSGYAEGCYYLCGVGEGYWLDVVTGVTYGDTVDYRVIKVTKGGDGSGTSEVVDSIGHQIVLGGEASPLDTSSPGSFVASDVGQMTLRVFYDVSGETKSVERPITVGQRPVTLRLPAATGGTGVPIGARTAPTAVSGNIVESPALDFLAANLDYTYRNAAGIVVSPEDVPNTPGYYEVSAVATGTLSQRYEARLLSGSYSVTGLTRTVSVSQRPFYGHYAGTLSMLTPYTVRTTSSQEPTCAAPAGTRIILSAIPDAGYVVYDWYVNGVPQGQASTTFSHTMRAEDTKIEVQFVVAPNALRYGAIGESEGGNVSCVTQPGLESGAVVMPGARLTFAATPQPGYHFVEWRYTPAGSATSYSAGTMGGATSTYTITMPNKTVTLYALFERDSYTLSLSQNLEAFYYGDHDNDATTPAEEIFIPAGGKVRGDTEVTVRPKEGYHVQPGAAWVAEGSQGAASDQSYTFVITQDTRVKTTVVRGSFTVQLGFATGSPRAGSTITYQLTDPEDGSVVSGVISGTSYTAPIAIPVAGGTELRATVSVSEVCDFVNWVNTTEDSGLTVQDPVFTLSHVGDDCRLLATLKEKPRWDIGLSTLPAGASYAVSVNRGPYASASADTSVSVVEGSSVSVSVTPPPGEVVGWWAVDGERAVASTNTYSFEDVMASHTISPEFVSMTYCTITWPGVSASQNGVTIVPQPGYLPIVLPGGEFRFKAQATSSYLTVGAVYANGKLVAADADGIYTLPSVYRNQVITVALAGMGVTVDGVDVGELAGEGWGYNVSTRVLTLFDPGLTLAGAMHQSSRTFSVVLGPNASTVTLHDFAMDAGDAENAIESLSENGVEFKLLGDNHVEIGGDASPSSIAGVSAAAVTFSDGSTGTLHIICGAPSSSVHGIVAERPDCEMSVPAGSLEIDVHSQSEYYGSVGITIGAGYEGELLRTGGVGVSGSGRVSIKGGPRGSVAGIYAPSVDLLGGTLSIETTSLAGVEFSAGHASGLVVDSASVHARRINISANGALVAVALQTEWTGGVTVSGGATSLRAVGRDATGIKTPSLANSGGTLEISTTGDEYSRPLTDLTYGPGGWTMASGMAALVGSTRTDVYQPSVSSLPRSSGLANRTDKEHLALPPGVFQGGVYHAELCSRVGGGRPRS